MMKKKREAMMAAGGRASTSLYDRVNGSANTSSFGGGGKTAAPEKGEKGKPRSLSDVEVGDTLEASGLKGADKEWNGEKGTIKEMLGFSNKSRRYVVRFAQFTINGAGDLAEKEKILTLTSDNVCLPGGFAIKKSRSRSRSSSSSSSSSRSRQKKKKSKRGGFS